MPRRDEEKRIAFLRTLATEDLANRRITEHSSEVEKRMVHDARDAMKEKNDKRYMTRHKKKAAVDVVKTQVNGVGRRAQAEFFGREGGITGGMVGSWLLGGTLIGGTIAGIASRGKFGAMAKVGGGIGNITRKRINYLNKTHLSNKDTDRFLTILKRADSGKRLDEADKRWLQVKTRYYRQHEKSKLPFAKKAKTESAHGNPAPKARAGQAGQPVKTNMPPTQPDKKVGNPKRTNPNSAAMAQPEKDALAKLKNGQRLTKEEYAVLRQLKKDGQLTKTQDSLLAARSRTIKAKRELKKPDAKPESGKPESGKPEPNKPADQAPQVVKEPPAIAPAKVETALSTGYSDDALKSMLSKNGKLPDVFPAYPNAVRQLREGSKRPDLMLNNYSDYAKQIDDFAVEIAKVAKRSPQADWDNVCLLLSHKIAQTNRTIENLGRSLYDKSKALLHEAGEIKKKVIP
jgi:hypothetical protein